MKELAENVVPLSDQAIETLNDLNEITGKNKWLFPSPSPDGRHLNEYEWPADIIEQQLYHVDKNTVIRTYNRVQYMPQRKAMNAVVG